MRRTRPLTPVLCAFLAAAVACGDDDLGDIEEAAMTESAADDTAADTDEALPSDDPVERTLEANGLDFVIIEQGRPASDEARPLVLLLHGFPDTPHTWDEIRPALAAAGYHVVSPWMRGYAPTGIPDGDTDAETLGRDVLALIEALGYERAHVIGHDWGAYATYAAASLDPAAVESIVTIAIPHPGYFVPDPGFLERATHFLYLASDEGEAIMREDSFAHVDELYRRWSPAWDLTDAELAEETARVKETFDARGSLQAALGYYRGNPPTIVPEFFQAPIEVPALTIAGRTDGVALPETFEATEPGFAAGWTLVVAEGGHFVHREDEAGTRTAIVEFLDQRPK